MPTLHIKLKIGDAELEIKADGELDKDTVNAIKNILLPVTSSLGSKGKSIENSQTHGASSELTEEELAQGNKRRAKVSTKLYQRFKDLIPQVFKYGQWFSSQDAREAFFDTFGIDVKPSTASTYLSRMVEEGILVSRREGRLKLYRVAHPHIRMPQVQIADSEVLY